MTSVRKTVRRYAQRGGPPVPWTAIMIAGAIALLLLALAFSGRHEPPPPAYVPAVPVQIAGPNPEVEALRQQLAASESRHAREREIDERRQAPRAPGNAGDEARRRWAEDEYIRTGQYPPGGEAEFEGAYRAAGRR